MVSYLTDIQLGIFIFIFNLPFVIIGYRQIGKTFALSTIFSAIIDRLGRGITLLEGKGAYSGDKTEVIYVVISRLELAKLKNIVHDFDEDALITITSVEGTGKKYAKKAIH